MQGGFFTALQNELNEDVLAAPVPLIGAQLATEAEGQFIAALDTTLVNFTLERRPTIAEVKQEADGHVGQRGSHIHVNVSGVEGDDEIRFQLTLFGTSPAPSTWTWPWQRPGHGGAARRDGTRCMWSWTGSCSSRSPSPKWTFEVITSNPDELTVT